MTIMQMDKSLPLSANHITAESLIPASEEQCRSLPATGEHQGDLTELRLLDTTLQAW